MTMNLPPHYNRHPNMQLHPGQSYNPHTSPFQRPNLPSRTVQGFLDSANLPPNNPRNYQENYNHSPHYISRQKSPQYMPSRSPPGNKKIVRQNYGGQQFQNMTRPVLGPHERDIYREDFSSHRSPMQRRPVNHQFYPYPARGQQNAGYKQMYPSYQNNIQVPYQKSPNYSQYPQYPAYGNQSSQGYIPPNQAQNYTPLYTQNQAQNSISPNFQNINQNLYNQMRNNMNSLNYNFNYEYANFDVDYTIEENLVYCVICDETYRANRKQQHLQKHREKARNIQIAFIDEKKLERFQRYNKMNKKGLIVKPIVEPEEFNIQYNPNQFILHKITNYLDQSDRDVREILIQTEDPYQEDSRPGRLLNQQSRRERSVQGSSRRRSKSKSSSSSSSSSKSSKKKSQQNASGPKKQFYQNEEENSHAIPANQLGYRNTYTRFEEDSLRREEQAELSRYSSNKERENLKEHNSYNSSRRTSQQQPDYSRKSKGKDDNRDSQHMPYQASEVNHYKASQMGYNDNESHQSQSRHDNSLEYERKSRLSDINQEESNRTSSKLGKSTSRRQESVPLNEVLEEKYFDQDY